MTTPREGRLEQMRESVGQVISDLNENATWIEMDVEKQTVEGPPNEGCWRSFYPTGWVEVRIKAYVPKMATGRILHNEH